MHTYASASTEALRCFEAIVRLQLSEINKLACGIAMRRVTQACTGRTSDRRCPATNSRRWWWWRRVHLKWRSRTVFAAARVRSRAAAAASSGPLLASSRADGGGVDPRALSVKRTTDAHAMRGVHLQPMLAIENGVREVRIVGVTKRRNGARGGREQRRGEGGREGRWKGGGGGQRNYRMPISISSFCKSASRGEEKHREEKLVKFRS